MKREKSVRDKTKDKGRRAPAMQAVKQWREAVVAQHRRALCSHRLAARQFAQTTTIEVGPVATDALHLSSTGWSGTAPKYATTPSSAANLEANAYRFVSADP